MIAHIRKIKGTPNEIMNALCSYFKCINSPIIKNAFIPLARIKKIFTAILGQDVNRYRYNKAITTSTIVIIVNQAVAFQTALTWLLYVASSI